eukprot:9711730-Ditylum_brightwellii.AAC.1
MRHGPTFPVTPPRLGGSHKNQTHNNQIKIYPFICDVLYYNVVQWCKLQGRDLPQHPADATGMILNSAVKEQQDI